MKQDGWIYARNGARFLQLGRTQPELLSLLQRLGEGASLDEVLNNHQHNNDVMLAALLQQMLSHLARSGLLCATLCRFDAIVAILHAAPASLLQPLASPPEQLLRWAALALLRQRGGQMVLEGALIGPWLEVYDTTPAQIMAQLTTPMPDSALADRLGFGLEALRLWLRILLAMEVVVTGQRSEPTTLEFHDRLFHTRSRAGVMERPMGPTWRRVPLPAQPLRRERWHGPVTRLPPPRSATGPLDEIMGQRRSLREWSQEPVSLEALSTLLHQSLRIQSVRHRDGQEAVTLRPYPSGGARYPLESYLLVHTVTGLAPGLYHYDAMAHDLVLVRSQDRWTDGLFGGAQPAGSRPAVLLIWTARFARVSRKYEWIAYALILKEVGAVMQCVYLVATALGLAPCALGNGNSWLFAEVTGLEAETEGPVGELGLGHPTAAISG